jgi:glyoxylase-like metal-dependent hydrolase (beta-lactamase superfamily II)
LSQLCFRQLKAGRDFAPADPIAGQMVNFVYLIGDRTSGEAALVDPAWDVRGLLEVAAGEGLKVRHALVSHYHPDHVGGNLFGHVVQGLAALQELQPVKVHVEKHEAEGLRKVTGLSQSDLVCHESGDRIGVGAIEIETIHTPGHTPGSQCFLLGNRLVAGDTLFVRGCGRVDLPGGDPEQMYFSLTQRLARLPDDTVLYPGHDYGPAPTSTLGEEREANLYLRVPSLRDWLRLMGRGLAEV